MNGLPFNNAQRVAFDPSDPDRITVTTFGGSVWRGPAAEPERWIGRLGDWLGAQGRIKPAK